MPAARVGCCSQVLEWRPYGWRGVVFCFFRQKAAYEVRIRDWSSDVCSSDLQLLALFGGIVLLTLMQPRLTLTALGVVPLVVGSAFFLGRRQIGRASRRERVCQYV